MQKVLIVIAVLLALLGIGYAMDKNLFTVQVAFILIFACIMAGGWALLKFIQKS